MLIIPLLAVGFYVGVKQNNFNKKDVNLTNFNPFQQVVVQEYTPRTEAPKAEDVLIIEKQLSEKTSSVQSSIIETEKATPKIIPAKIDSTYVVPKTVVVENKYHVIVGCFSVKENAESLVKKWRGKGNSSKIIDQEKGLYRVSIQSFKTRSEAKKFMKTTREQSKISLWLLKK